MNAGNVLGKLQNEAGTKLNQYRQDQIAKFRTEIKPLAQEIAAKRGLSIVIPKNEGLLLSVDPGVDITDDVIKAYLAKRPAPTASVRADSVPAKSPAPAAPEQSAAAMPKDAGESTN